MFDSIKVLNRSDFKCCSGKKLDAFQTKDLESTLATFRINGNIFEDEVLEMKRNP